MRHQQSKSKDLTISIQPPTPQPGSTTSIPSSSNLPTSGPGDHPPVPTHTTRRPSSSSAFFTNPYRSSEPGANVSESRPASPTSSDSEMSDSTLLEKSGSKGSSVQHSRRSSSERDRRGEKASFGDILEEGDVREDGLGIKWAGLPLPTSMMTGSSSSDWRISSTKLRLWAEQVKRGLSSSSTSGGWGAHLRSMLSGRRGVVVFLGVMVLMGLGLLHKGTRLDVVSRGVGRSTFAYNGHPTWFLPKLTQTNSFSPLARNVSSPLREIDISSEPLPLDATLSERLLAWERAPGGRGPGLHLGLDGKYHEEVELGGFQAWNLESCANIAPQMNTHMVQYAAQVWSSFNRTTLHNTRMTLIEHMRDVERKGLLEKTGEGRGIVMVAGNADTLQRVIWSVQFMRNKGTTLPVQVYHFPGEEPPEGDGIYNQLRDLNIELVAAPGQSKDEGKTKSYHLKAIAVVQCPYQEVLYMDSDNIPTRDPEYMFESPSYKRMGIWAVYDYWKTSGNNAIWAILGIRCRDEWEMEAGQIFVDKKRHLDVFLLTQFMLEHHEYFFYFSDGDKDIFRWALLALRKRWGVPGRWVGVAALPGATASGDHCGHTMLQHDAYGEPLFVHYNLLKQIPSGVGRGFTWGKTKQLPLFNSFPPPANYAHANELPYSDHDLSLHGLGNIDCDMLADADDEGHARAPAREEVRRRAARERGVKARYHGGWISALCIDLDYEDPRPEVIRKAEEKVKEERERLNQEAQDAGLPPPAPDAAPEEGAATKPNWGESPIETVFWRDSDLLRDMESNLYDMGFKPNGPGF